MGWARKGYPKAVKSLIFNAINHVCTCMDRIEQKYRQKCAHKSFKNAKIGVGGAGRGRGMEWTREGVESLGKQYQWIYNGRGGCW